MATNLMTEVRLEAIRQWRNAVTDPASRRGITWRLINDLLVEVDRRGTRLAALEKVVAQVVFSNDEHGEGARCHFCGATPAISGSHMSECQREQARALLADES